MFKLKAVIFDYGNVISQPPDIQEWLAMADILGVDQATFISAWRQDRLDYDAGRIEAAAYWQKLSARLNKALSKEEIESLIAIDIGSWTRPNNTVIKWIPALQQQGIKVGLLTNMPWELYDILIATTWLPEFDHATFSCETGFAKPQQEIYQHCLEGLNVEARETLFIDDLPINIEAAEKLGIYTLQHNSPEISAAEIKSRFELHCPVDPST